MMISLIEGVKLKAITKALKKSFLFADMTESEIEKVLICSGATVKAIDKNEIIFDHDDTPKYLFVLLEGAVAVCKDSISGKRGIVTVIERPGDIFGEIYLFLPKNEYDFYTLVTHQAQVMMIPREFFSSTCSNKCNYHSKLIDNMLGILAQKAYYLGQKLQILSSGSLRQKISKYLLDNCDSKGFIKMKMNREVFADYLIVARPSLSRELLKMQDEGLINVDGKNIKIVELDALEAEL
ncbi:Crp/Fnr family transcriptional regulator [Proteocatella sphenisci]|uniref:Crp/Fnr family transcriptional regulator n=1 Tax=Proteocatella sphenisci TaxID=181070 RepID=UPI0004B8B192|nr:Crp/Fnr family transcriptional regulator [Proteocatella sphenisci]